MRGRSGAGALVVWGCLEAVAAAGPAPAPAFDKPAFTASPAELLALARAVPAGDDPMVVLRQRDDIRYDDHGRATRREWQLWVMSREVTAKDHADDDDDDGDDGDDDETRAVFAGWSPAYQDRPVVRARVIDPSGRVATLDAAAVIDDVPAAGATGGWRHVTAKLPHVAVGAVVERETVITDREPAPIGEIMHFALASEAAGRVISVSAPVSLKLHHIARGLPAAVRARHQVAGGQDRWTYDVPTLGPRPAFEVGVPSDVPTSPLVAWSATASWQVIARARRAAFDHQIAAGPVELPAELRGPPSAATADAITAWMHRQVPLGRSITVAELPLPPAETLQGKSRGALDRAVLLVALLRQAQIRADVALMAASYFRVVDPALPGLVGLDRPLVRVRLAGAELWIDPGDPLARPGQLPVEAHGRRALVIADDTTALTTTPVSAASDNLIREVRTFTVPELGPSQVTVEIRATGAFESAKRREYLDLATARMKKHFASIAEQTYVGAFDRVTTTDVHDLGVPFAITMSFKNARRAVALDDELGLHVYPADVFDELLWAAPPPSQPPRVHDFAWDVPHVYELEHRIIVPPGFTLPAAAPDGRHDLGSAIFTEHQEISGRTMIVSYRFETTRPRLTAAELTALQAAVRELTTGSTYLAIDRTASGLARDGKFREAVAECQRMIAAHPGEALHHQQLAELLLRTGSGEAARREARRAVELAPASADAHATLGRMLTFDSLGREFGYDWDRPGAIAVLRKARALDPANGTAAIDLGWVLRHGASGEVYTGDGADLRAAIEALRAAHATVKSESTAIDLSRLLLQDAQFAEAEQVLRAVPASEQRDRWLLAAVAGGRGAAAAAKELELLHREPRTEWLINAAWQQAFLRRYARGRELLAEVGTVSPRLHQLFDKLAAHPAIPSGTADPRAAVLDLMMALIEPRHPTAVFRDAATERELRDAPLRWQPVELIPQGDGRAGRAGYISDVLQSAGTIAIEGDARLWRATVQFDGAPEHFYLVLDGKTAKVIGSSQASSSAGRYLLRTLDAGNEPRARRLLDWLLADVAPSKKSDEQTFEQWWKAGAPMSLEHTRIAAAVLSGGGEPEAELAAARRCGSKDPRAASVCNHVRTIALQRLGRWAEVVREIDARVAANPAAAASLKPHQALALANAGQYDDAEHAIDAVLASDPDNEAAAAMRFMIAVLRGNTADAAQRAAELAQRPSPGPMMLNNAAWIQLGAGEFASALVLARRAIAGGRSAWVLNTLAAIEAELGDLAAAVADQVEAVKLRGAGPPQASDWYVAGRIYEQLGLTADAVAVYQRIPRPADLRFSTYSLAQRRLAALRSH